MVNRKGELSSGEIDRGWPYQVVLKATSVSGMNYPVVQQVCKELSLRRRGHSFRLDDEDYVVFCFAADGHAALFYQRFDGVRTMPKDRPTRRVSHSATRSKRR